MNTHRRSIALFLAMIATGVVTYACSDDEPAKPSGGTSGGSSGGTSGGSSGGTSGGSSGATSGGTSGTTPTTLKAKADITPTSSASTVKGTAEFVEEDGTTTVTITITEGGGAAGKHGVHIHQNGNCDTVNNDAGHGAGGHWNPADAGHGQPTSDPHHLGDLGNITIDDQGKGTLTLKSTEFTVKDGPTSVVGHAVIYHAREDDFTQPVGNAGGRPGCGIITKQ